MSAPSSRNPSAGLVLRRVRQRSQLMLLATALTAGGLALTLYFVSSSLPYLVASPTADPVFGALNHCLLSTLGQRSAGFAVANDGLAAAFSGSRVAVCRDAADAGVERSSFPLSGVTDAAFDGHGTLWLANGEGLWKLAPKAEAPERAGALSPVALSGHSRGVVALERSGKLISLTSLGEVLGVFQLPFSAPSPQLAVSGDGRLLAVVAGGGLFILEALSLAPLRVEAPCEVSFLWWTDPPSRALVSCGPEESWALFFDGRTGEREEAPRRERVKATHLAAGRYVQECERLPCTSPPP